MPRKPPDKLTQDEIKLLVSAAKMLAALQAYLAALPPQDETCYWNKNIREELTMVNIVYGSGRFPHCHPILQIMGHRWTAAEQSKTPPDWAGLSLDAVFQSCDQQAVRAPEWHVDLFSHDLTHYLRDIPAKKQWWNIRPAPADPEDDVDMDEPVCEPSPAPPSPPISSASQKRAAKGKGRAAPQTTEEYGPPKSRRKRGTKHSTTLPDSDVPADTPSEGDTDKDAPTGPLLPQAPPRVDVEGPSPPRPTEDGPKKPMVALGDNRCGTCKERNFPECTSQMKGNRLTITCQYCATCKLPCRPPPLWACTIYDVANTLAPGTPPGYWGIPERLDSLEHEIDLSKRLLLAICNKLGINMATIPGYNDPPPDIPPPSPSNQSALSRGLGVSSIALSDTQSMDSLQSSNRSERPEHPAFPDQDINEYDDAERHTQFDRMDLNMEDVTAMIRALCEVEGVDVPSVSDDVEGSQSDVPSQAEQCSSDVDV
ncbi:hypothetical protein EI94DRAFT_1800313 [Lactarius quietus]|nr:hypothetical protein EI94DRAFT_1800313 [Lactarius quietus]